VRVLDAGADKPLSFLNDAHEENPALGLRGIRAPRALRGSSCASSSPRLAMADAATDADLWVMAPMIATVEETALLHRRSPTELGIKSAGVMVEDAVAALIADRGPRVAAFASIGTNDLTQYTMAADRCSAPWRSCRARGIRRAAASSREVGAPAPTRQARRRSAARPPPIRCSPCVLVGLGATSLSMSPLGTRQMSAPPSRGTRPDDREGRSPGGPGR
jgi:phosphotransferase system enzyme I (PtsI)